MDQMKIKKVRTAKDPHKAVFAYFVKEGQAGIPISSPVLSIQAQNLPSDLHVVNHSYCDTSKGWLYHFQCCSK